jgi:hypothetical protein
MSKSSVQKSIVDAQIPETIKASVEAIAKGLGVAAVELWAIFVRQYVVKGLTELFTALVLVGSGVFLIHLVDYWSLVPMAASLPFFYGTILLLGNPKYGAIQDITRKIKELK